MSSSREKERLKDQQEKFQAILSALLKDEDNKYCIDCDAKGPRWASWNIGIFMCIRCAGIHRNLGVHISKVKSVNLDTWTPPQVAMMQEMGNSRGRAVYEANIPDGFRRPQTDSALESFIRAKYESKKYIAREFVPPKPTIPKEWTEDSRDKKRTRAKNAGSVQLPSAPSKTSEIPRQAPKTEVKIPVQAAAPKPATTSNDLLGLEAPAPVPSSGGNELLDIFGGFQSTPAVPPTNAPVQTSTASDITSGSSANGNLFGTDAQAAGAGEEKKSAKDSIMALFGGSGGGGSGSSQPQIYGVPGGVYMAPGQGQQGQQAQQGFPGMMTQPQAQQPGMMGAQQGMLGNQQAMMGNQGMMGNQQGMMGNQQNMMGNQQGMMGSQQNLMGNQQQAMMGNQGMMGNQQGMMGNQPGMPGNQQGMPSQNMMNGSQQGNMYNNQHQMTGANQMYNPQQMQQLQFQQMQQQMNSMNLQAPQGQAAQGWGAPQGQTLANNLWQ